MEIKQFAPQDHFVRCTIYGGSWVGKTVFGGTAPKPIFASSEKWLLSIVSTLGYYPDYVNIESIKDLQELYKHLKKTNTYQTLVLDSLTEINEIIKEGIENRTGKQLTRNERWELSRKIKDIIRSFKDLPMHVIVICQEKHNVNDEGVTESIYPMLNGKNATEIAYMMDIVGYMYIDKDGERHITTAPNQKLLSKDRSGQIGRDASLEFKEWVTRIGAIKQPSSLQAPSKKSFTDKELTEFEASLIAGEIFFTTPDDAKAYLAQQGYTVSSSMDGKITAVMLTSLMKSEQQKNVSSKDVSEKNTDKTIAK